MNRFQLLNIQTGEIVWPKNAKTNRRERLQHVLQTEDKRRGKPVRKSYHKSSYKTKREQQLLNETLFGLALGFAFCLALVIGTN